MAKDLKLLPTSDVEAKERPAPQETRAEWQRPALIRLATSEASMAKNKPGHDSTMHDHS
jgi:hypothetical protein